MAELLMTPAPLMVKCERESTGVIVKALAPGPKTMLLTSVVNWAEKVTVVTLDTLKVATSDGPLGTVSGVQLLTVFQSELVGLDFHVALPA